MLFFTVKSLRDCRVWMSVIGQTAVKQRLHFTPALEIYFLLRPICLKTKQTETFLVVLGLGNLSHLNQFLKTWKSHGILKVNFQALEKFWKCVGPGKRFEICFICILIFKYKWMNKYCIAFIQANRLDLRSWELTHRIFYAAATAFLQMQAVKVQKYLGNAGSKNVWLLMDKQIQRFM